MSNMDTNATQSHQNQNNNNQSNNPPNPNNTQSNNPNNNQYNNAPIQNNSNNQMAQNNINSQMGLNNTNQVAQNNNTNQMGQNNHAQNNNSKGPTDPNSLMLQVSTQEKRISELTQSLNDRNSKLQKFQTEKKSEMEALMAGMKQWIQNLPVKSDSHRQEFEKGLQRLVDTSSFDNNVWQVMSCASASAAKMEEQYQVLKGQYDELQQRNTGGFFGNDDQRVGDKRPPDGDPNTDAGATPDIWSAFISDVATTGYQVQ
jgi:hypothetical protein